MIFCVLKERRILLTRYFIFILGRLRGSALLDDPLTNFYDDNFQVASNFGTSFPESYVCPRCGKAYTNISNLNRHKNYECGHERRFSCQFCLYKSHYKFNLQAHVAKRHKNELNSSQNNARR